MLRSHKVKTRKNHLCFGCSQEIKKGCIAELSTNTFEGNIYNLYICEKCLKHIKEKCNKCKNNERNDKDER